MILAQPGMLRNFGCSDRLGNMRQYIVLCFFGMGIPRVVFFRFADFFAEFACGIFDDWRDFGGLSGKEQPVQKRVDRHCRKQECSMHGWLSVNRRSAFRKIRWQCL